MSDGTQRKSPRQVRRFNIMKRIKIKTWDAQGLGQREQGMAKELKMKNINITVIA